MDDQALNERINDLESMVANLETKIEVLTRFSALLLGRYASETGDAPDLGPPDDPLSTGNHDLKLAMLLAYNSAAL